MLIELTRIDGSKININFFQIEMVERKTNTVIRMINEVSYIVTETPAEIEEKIKNIFGTKVKLISGNKGGKIVIEFYSSKDLERIIELIDTIKV